MKFAGMRLRENSRYAGIVTTVLPLMALMLSAAAIDTWTVVRFFGGRNPPVEATAWRDSVFGLPLGFYLFDLPFYGLLRGFVLLLAIAGAIVYWLTARGWQLRGRITVLQEQCQLDMRIFNLKGALQSRFIRGSAAAIDMRSKISLSRSEIVFLDITGFQ